MNPYIWGTLWTYIYVSMGIPLSSALFWLLNVVCGVIVVYFALCWTLIHWGKQGKLPDELTKKLKEDFVMGPLLIDGSFALLIFFAFVFLTTTGETTLYNLFFLTGGFIGLLCFFELSLHIFLQYNDSIEKLKK